MTVQTAKTGCIVFSKLHYVVDSGAPCKVAMLGSTPELGEWNAARAVVGEQSKIDAAYWCFNVHMDDGAEFKYVLLNTATTSVERWEERGTNRRLLPPRGAPTHPVLMESVWGHGARCLVQDPDLHSVYSQAIMAPQRIDSIIESIPNTRVSPGQLLYDHHYIPWVMVSKTPRAHAGATMPSLLRRFLGRIPLLSYFFKDS